MCYAIIPVTAKNKSLSIGAKHREGIKAFITAYLFYILPIAVSNIHIEWKASIIPVVVKPGVVSSQTTH